MEAEEQLQVLMQHLQLDLEEVAVDLNLLVQVAVVVQVVAEMEQPARDQVVQVQLTPEVVEEDLGILVDAILASLLGVVDQE
tara:strand:- start:35 stop:280 length:246 start_codon:yes stop_codon:yes gene_type:complete